MRPFRVPDGMRSSTAPSAQAVPGAGTPSKVHPRAPRHTAEYTCSALCVVSHDSTSRRNTQKTGKIRTVFHSAHLFSPLTRSGRALQNQRDIRHKVKKLLAAIAAARSFFIFIGIPARSDRAHKTGRLRLSQCSGCLSSPRKNTATVPGPQCEAMMVPMSQILTSPLMPGNRSSSACLVFCASSGHWEWQIQHFPL